MRAQLGEASQALAKVTSQLTSTRSALDAANSRAARHARVNSVATTPGAMLLRTPAPSAAQGTGSSPDTADEPSAQRRDPLEWSRAHQALERSASLQPDALPSASADGAGSEGSTTRASRRGDDRVSGVTSAPAGENARAAAHKNDGRRARPSPILDRTRSPLKVQPPHVRSTCALGVGTRVVVALVVLTHAASCVRTPPVQNSGAKSKRRSSANEASGSSSRHQGSGKHRPARAGSATSARKRGGR